MAQSDLLERIRIKRSVPTASYFQLCSEIRRLVTDGTLQPGEQLPTIAKLSKAFGLSRTTIVRALGELSRQGVVTPRWGAGNFIAEHVAPLTELLVHGAPSQTSPLGFYDQIVQAFGQAVANGERRISLSYTHGRTPSAREVLNVAAARGTDSLVVYRPAGAFEREMRSVAVNLPTVSLFQPLHEAPADAIISDPTAPLQKALQRRWHAGQRRFFLISIPFLMNPPSESPYAAMREALHAMAEKAGVQLDEHPLESLDSPERLAEELSRVARRIPRGATVLTHTYRLFELPDRKFDVIAYTESPSTLERYGDRCSILYCDLNVMAARAMKLLMERKAAAHLEPRVLRLAPEMIERGRPSARGARRPALQNEEER